MSALLDSKPGGAVAAEAVRLATDGWHVHPLHGITTTGCTCGRPCAKPGKHPRLPNGLNGATADSVVVAGWWRRWPVSNIGLRTGHGPTPVFVVDIDGPQGEDTFRALQRAHGPVPPTRWVRTGSGGWHGYFLMPTPVLPGTVRKLGPGLDTRGTGGYVLVPPSTHISGGTYTWWDEEAEVAELPRWLVRLLRPPAPPPRRPLRLAGNGDAYAAAALRGECAAVATTGEGARNHRLNVAAFNLGTLIGAGRLDEATVAAALLDAALRAGLGEREAERTIASGMTAGRAHPRAVAS